MYRHSLVCFCILATPVTGSPCSSGSESFAPQHEEVDDGTAAEDVEIRTGLDDRMTVAVRVAGTGPFRFLVDTGADRTAVSSDVAKRLGLKVGAKIALHALTGVSHVSTVTLPDLQLTRTGVTVVDAPVLESEHIGADGILGVDSLQSQRVLLDFDKDMMTIIPAEREVARA